jgi:protease I
VKVAFLAAPQGTEQRSLTNPWQAVHEAGPAAAICHAPGVLIEAGVLPRRIVTSWPSLRTDLRIAGDTWVDEPVHLCTAGPNTLMTSRAPDDLPAFDDALATVLRHL